MSVVPGTKKGDRRKSTVRETSAPAVLVTTDEPETQALQPLSPAEEVAGSAAAGTRPRSTSKERTKYKARAGPLSVPTTGGRSSGEEDNDVVVGSVGSGRRPSAIARAVTAQSTGVTTPGGIDSTLRHNSSPLRQMLQLHRENTIQRSNTGSYDVAFLSAVKKRDTVTKSNTSSKPISPDAEKGPVLPGLSSVESHLEEAYNDITSASSATLHQVNRNSSTSRSDDPMSPRYSVRRTGGDALMDMMLARGGSTPMLPKLTTMNSMPALTALPPTPGGTMPPQSAFPKDDKEDASDDDDAVTPTLLEAPETSRTPTKSPKRTVSNLSHQIHQDGDLTNQSLLKDLQRIWFNFRHPFKEQPLTGWDLQFPGPLEALYQNFYFNQDLTAFRQTLVHIIFAFTLSVIFLTAIRGRCETWCPADIYALVQGLVTIVILLPLFICLKYVEWFQDYFRQWGVFAGCVVSSVMVFSGTLRYLMLDYSDENVDFYESINPGVFVLVAWSYCNLPVTYIQAAKVALAFSAIDMIFTIGAAASGVIPFEPAQFTFANAILYLLANIICIFASYMRELYVRQFFLKAREAQERQLILNAVKEQSDIILYSILPMKIVDQLKQESRGMNGLRRLLVNEHENVSILFADIAGFTAFSATVTPSFLVDFLNDLFMRFDMIAETYGVEKIKTLGDCYMACAGVPEPLDDHAERICLMAIDMAEAMNHGLHLSQIPLNGESETVDRAKALRMRIGIHSGKVVAGVIGVRKFKYDVWSEDVNYASLMEQSGQPGQVHISEATYELIKFSPLLIFTSGPPNVKNGVEQKTYFVSRYVIPDSEDGSAPSSLAHSESSRPSVLSLGGHGGPKDPNYGRRQSKHPELTLASMMSSTLNLHEKPVVPKEPKERVGSPIIKSILTPKKRSGPGSPMSFTSQQATDDLDAPKSGPIDLIVTSPSSENMLADSTSMASSSSSSRGADAGINVPQTSPPMHATPHVHPLRVPINGSPMTSPLASPLSAEPSLINSPSKEDSSLIAKPSVITTNSSVSITTLDSTVTAQKSKSSLAAVPSSPRMGGANGHGGKNKLQTKQSVGIMFNPQSRQAQEDRILGRIQKQMTWTGSFVDRTVESEFKLTYTRYATESSVYMAIGTILMNVAILVVHALVFWANPYALYAQTALVVVQCIYVVWLRYNKSFQVEISPVVPGSTETKMMVSSLDPHLALLPMLWVLFMGVMAFFSSVVLDVDQDGTLALYMMATFSIVVIAHIVFIGLRSLKFNISAFAMLVCFFTVYYVLATQNFVDMSFLDSFIFDQFVYYIVIIWLVAILFNTRIDLIARRHYLINMSLEKKGRETLKIQHESEKLLSNIMPSMIADRLLKNPNSSIADPYEQVAIIFCTIANFKGFEELHPTEVVSVLNEIMSDIDEKCDEFGVEKIKTIGPTYMAMAGGLPSDVPGSPLVRMCRFAFEIKKIIARNNEVLNANFEIRIGLNVGPVVTGVIGTQKFAFDVWGDTVNTASRMDYTGLPGRIQVTKTVQKMLKDLFTFEYRGLIPVKGKGKLKTYFLEKEGKATEKSERRKSLLEGEGGSSSKATGSLLVPVLVGVAKDKLKKNKRNSVVSVSGDSQDATKAADGEDPPRASTESSSSSRKDLVDAEQPRSSSDSQPDSETGTFAKKQRAHKNPKTGESSSAGADAAPK